MGGTLGHLRLRVRCLRTLRLHASHFHVASRRVVMQPSWWILSDRGQWPLFFDMGRGLGQFTRAALLSGGHSRLFPRPDFHLGR